MKEARDLFPKCHVSERCGDQGTEVRGARTEPHAQATTGVEAGFTPDAPEVRSLHQVDGGCVALSTQPPLIRSRRQRSTHPVWNMFYLVPLRPKGSLTPVPIKGTFWHLDLNHHRTCICKNKWRSRVSVSITLSLLSSSANTKTQFEVWILKILLKIWDFLW